MQREGQDVQETVAVKTLKGDGHIIGYSYHTSANTSAIANYIAFHSSKEDQMIAKYA